MDTKEITKLLQDAKNTVEGFYLIIKFKDLLKLWKDAILVPYNNNRSGNLNSKRIEDIAENFNLFGFGQVTASFHDGKIELVDAHHRIYAIELLNDKYLGFGEIENKDVVLFVVPSSKRMSTYQALNRGKSHTGYEKVNQPDLAVGSYSNEIIDAAEEKTGGSILFNRKQTQNLMDLVYCYSELGNKFELENVYEARTEVSKLLDSAVDRRSFSLEDFVVKKSTDFVTKYLSLIYLAEKSDIKSEVVSTIKSPGFLLTMGLDYFTDGSAINGFSKKPNTDILNKVKGKTKLPKILESCQAVARRNRKRINIPDIKKAFG